MKVLVTGGREFKDAELLNSTLTKIHNDIPITLIIHGGAKGADRLAGEWANANKIICMVFHADWSKHGLAAGPIRNSEMLKEIPDLVVAFPGGPGTADMTRKAKLAGFKMMVFQGETSGKEQKVSTSGNRRKKRPLDAPGETCGNGGTRSDDIHSEQAECSPGG
jgi:hypothetical protein